MNSRYSQQTTTEKADMLWTRGRGGSWFDRYNIRGFAQGRYRIMGESDRGNDLGLRLSARI